MDGTETSGMLSVVFEFILAMTALVGGGVLLYFRPGDANTEGFVGLIVGSAVSWWFGKRTSTSTAQQVTKATNGALSSTVQTAVAQALANQKTNEVAK